MDKYVLAIDQGTSSTRCILFDHDANSVGSHQVEHKQHTPQPGWVEHDAMEIWENTVDCINQTLQRVNMRPDQVAALGITNQRETTVVWNKRTGKPYHNAIVWNDNRTTSIAERLARVGGKDRLRPKTGLPLAPYLSATKLIWLLDNVDGLRKDAESGEALFGTIDTWLVYKLTNGRLHITDATNASRTLMMSLYTLDWDDELLQILNVPRAMLPEIRSSSEVYGHTDAVAPGIPIAGILGDQQAALFGQHCMTVGDAKVTFGTGAFMLLNTGKHITPSENGLLTTVAYKLGQNAEAIYALEGSVSYCGALIQWLRDNLQIIESSKDSEGLAASIEDNGGVYFVPAFNGLFTPYWRNDARGVIVGLTSFNTKAHICRAALESAAYQVKEVLDAAYNDSAVSIRSLKVDGGMTLNSLLMQFLSDLLGVPVIRPHIVETTALGAAFATGLAVHYWESTNQLKELWRKDKEWKPSMDEMTRVTLLRNWRKAIRRSLNWTDTEEVERDGPVQGINDLNNIYRLKSLRIAVSMFTLGAAAAFAVMFATRRFK